MVRAALACVVLACTFPVSAWAQSAWLEREPRPSVFLEVLLPQLDRDTEFPTWTWFLDARKPMSDHTALAVELPYARGEILDPPFPNETGGTIGNPYFGIAYAPRPSGMHVEAGFRLPLVGEDSRPAAAVGFLSDIEREEAFVPDQLPVRVAFHFVSAADEASHFTYDARIVPSVWIKTGNALSHGESFLGYGLTIRGVYPDVRAGVGFTGRWNLSSEGADFAGSTVHEFDAAADFLHGSVRPGLELKAPLDQGLSEALDLVWGVTLTVLP
jgi:hypothetical protein